MATTTTTGSQDEPLDEICEEVVNKLLQLRIQEENLSKQMDGLRKRIAAIQQRAPDYFM
jgi:hypothetical protein